MNKKFRELERRIKRLERCDLDRGLPAGIILKIFVGVIGMSLAFFALIFLLAVLSK